MVSASHWVGFTLPGMIDEPGSFSGMRSSPMPAARAGGEPAHVVGDLHERAGQRLAARRCAFTSASCADSAANLFGARRNGMPGQLGDLRGGAVGEARVGVEAGADRRAAERQLVAGAAASLRCRASRGRAAPPSRRTPGPASAASASCRCVRPILTMSANSLLFAVQRVAQRLRPPGSACAVTCSAAAMCIAVGKVSLRRLRHVDVVVGVDRLLGAAARRRRARSRGWRCTSLAFMLVCVPLPVCQTTSGNCSSSLPSMTSSAARDDQLGLVLGQLAELPVGQRRGLLEDAERADDRRAASRRGRWGSARASAASARPSSDRLATSMGPMVSVSVRVPVITEIVSDLDLRGGVACRT